MTLSPIILSQIVDPPNVIKINGHCFYLIPRLTSDPETNIWDDVESEWDDCISCKEDPTLLMHFNDPSGTNWFIDEKNHTITSSGGLVIDGDVYRFNGNEE